VQTLLPSGLPFISNLTKYYDLGFMEHKEIENPQGNKENRADVYSMKLSNKKCQND
jgi:hypothetical protein